MAAQPNAPESAWPVRELNSKVKSWIERLGHLWVEGQITQLNMKPSWKFSYITLRDPEAEASVQLTCATSLLHSLPSRLQDGDRVVVYGKPAFYEGRGSFSLWVTDIRPVGVGELLARIERLRQQLASEGLFDPALKKPLPFLPHTIGLITGRGSAAERDVLAVAHSRWPEVKFNVINTAVQGARAVPEIIEALQRLDADPSVDVIIIARGGGSVEDLLPFSEEALQRAVVAAHTPVVSAIGHEPDNPVLDNVADLRAATPTDAAKKVVPDVAAERQLIAELRSRSAAALRGWVHKERQQLAAVRSRPALADPVRAITLHREEIARSISSIRRDMRYMLSTERATVASLRQQVAALGPSATLARGYAVVQVVPRDGSAPEVVTTIGMSPPGSQLRIRVADGSITAAAMQTIPAD
ncbi:exodeoxyribonuclease VII large subunit [Corynebacterium diphtheriae bv. mitis]|uniref:Exodeoxyribonuclease 7 large subunit n=1 Tax=Corynebacterium diphtheriae bv. gravis TaxID=1720349 RepID=A0AAX0J0S1_CORDP|nr:exodeoxyribonuclease VII large subunit [Corynebacterium diphtheriae]ERA56490.1 exodeoxyribonuclease VII large subunit [Corynebacterium diphtheriae DSM 43988]OWN11657.1 exodeoxyribonuclease VII large subunit [Corynebacterium belfantii]AEX43915.1 exodeoxyribonuclease VII large subunit [Corynebacterium diphtheriae 241]AEX67054.1 exodeoxyribonuclease VII large subunit [Corynebacterium diphtheriae C7 (beta)]AEX74101.1 exodeoxyribonuclease VII large subunit [Corynebacterium diphtheriae HC01]